MYSVRRDCGNQQEQLMTQYMSEYLRHFAPSARLSCIANATDIQICIGTVFCHGRYKSMYVSEKWVVEMLKGLGWLIANSKAGFYEHNGEVLGSVSEKFMSCQTFRNHHSPV
jgi:hypothetical protein